MCVKTIIFSSLGVGLDVVFDHIEFTLVSEDTVVVGSLSGEGERLLIAFSSDHCLEVSYD